MMVLMGSTAVLLKWNLKQQVFVTVYTEFTCSGSCPTDIVAVSFRKSSVLVHYFSATGHF